MKRSERTPSAVCASCEQLRAQLSTVESERDIALLSLAQERERLNALRLALPAAAHGFPPEYPSAGPGPAPFRYVVADRLNDGLKRGTQPLQQLAKGWLQRWLRR